MTAKDTVFIIGAGPSGLMLALALTRHGIKVRIIDKTEGPGTTSRAMIVHARVLEFYRQLGLADEVVKRGLVTKAVSVFTNGKTAGRNDLSAMGMGLSPYPYVLSFPQDAHEKFLIECLEKLGVQVERRSELIDFTQSEFEVTAQIKHANGEIETAATPYLIGCDGARSKVRETLKIGFAGDTYTQLFYVADVTATGNYQKNEVNIALDDDDFVIVFPQKGENTIRLVGYVEGDANHPHPNLQYENVKPESIHKLGIMVSAVNWFSTYRVHHRVAENFQVRRAFLVGDAGHIHSPVGGQGMNTGISDAYNLAWKLAMVMKKQATSDLLKSYERERRAFAKRLVSTTDRAFSFLNSTNPLIRFLRLNLLPRVLPLALKFARVKRFMFLTVSQTAIEYRASSLSRGRAGIHGGDRLPWVKLINGHDNFEVLQDLSWQLHVYGEASPDIHTLAKKRALRLHVFSWEPEMRRHGLRENAFYLIRPDGYVAVAGRETEFALLSDYFQDFNFTSV